ncbi:SDR family oxidoreductase [Hyalangium sp.]|uniref:SDR family oxidoreductase n=1 Tax=Hyalangium sp. TaxID=2028555 RepID=UPI002D37928F|nr:SDR family oxidoreductase [Hyalangium sp.]HYH95611.1 SDR family oxidoreductase [Hyalangium sp.]
MIVVTGATGQIGSELVLQLAEKGEKVHAVIRDPKKAMHLNHPNVMFVMGDFADPKSLDAAFRGAQKLFLLTNADPKQVELQHNAIEAAKRAGIQHVVKLSALGASQDAPVSLGRWHYQTEEELKKSGLKWTILQPHFFMQNLGMMAGSVKAQGAIYAPAKDGKIAIVDTRDIAAVAAGVLTQPGHEGQTYVITGGEAISFNDIAKQIGEAIGKPVKYVDVPPEDARKSMLGMGMPEWFANDLVGLYGIFAAGHGAATTDVVQKVAKATPRTFAQFAKENAEMFQ